MDLFEDFILRNNDKVSNILLGHDIVNNCSREKLKSLFLRSEVVEELLENCESLIESDCYFNSLGQGHEEVHISMKILLGYYNSTYFLIDYNTEEDEPLKVEVFEEIPLNHCYKSCKEKFEWIKILLDGYDEHKDNKEFTKDYSLEVNWGFDFLQYLSNKGFDTSLFLRIQNRLEEYDLLSEIINEINEYYGKVPEGTEEGTKKLIKDIVNDDEFKSVIKSNNTDSNKRDKLQEIIGDKNIKTLDTNHKLYDYFEKEDVREKMIRMFISRPELLNQLRS